MSTDDGPVPYCRSQTLNGVRYSLEISDQPTVLQRNAAVNHDYSKCQSQAGQRRKELPREHEIIPCAEIRTFPALPSAFGKPVICSDLRAEPYSVAQIEDSDAGF